MNTPALGFKSAPVQRLRRLLKQPSERLESKLFVIEGLKLLDEALSSGAHIDSVFHERNAAPELLKRARLAKATVAELESGVMERISDTQSPQPVITLVRFINHAIEKITAGSFIIVCVDVRDPGNMGTIFRTAEAAGADGILFSEGCADAYNPKTLRAAAGAHFHVPFLRNVPVDKMFKLLEAEGVQSVATVSHNASDLYDTKFGDRVAVVLGNEANGLPQDVIDRCDLGVTIPIAGRSESLNVGMAGAVVCFEIARQRRE